MDQTPLFVISFALIVFAGVIDLYIHVIKAETDFGCPLLIWYKKNAVWLIGLCFIVGSFIPTYKAWIIFSISLAVTVLSCIKLRFLKHPPYQNNVARTSR